MSPAYEAGILPTELCEHEAGDGTRTHCLTLTKGAFNLMNFTGMSKRAEDGNRTREVLLGKQVPGQREQPLHESTGRDLNPQPLAWKASALPLSHQRVCTY